MNESGISRLCVVCHKVFHCTDGDYFCSSKCYDHYEKLEEMELNEDEMD